MALGKEDISIKSKMERAVELMDSTDIPLSGIAPMVGYAADGVALANRLVESGHKTEEDIVNRAKDLRSGKHVTN